MIGGEETINPLDLTQVIVFESEESKNSYEHPLFESEMTENSSEHPSSSSSISSGGEDRDNTMTTEP